MGTIKSSNLCAEITEYTDKNETACCNLASIALSKFVISPIIPYDPITIYTKSGCNYCKLAKMLLTNHGINFTICSLDDDKVRADFFEKINEPHTVPQIYVGDERIGGYDKLFDMLKPTYDFEKLRQISRIITRNLDKIINVNFYPIPESETSNQRHRPIGIGVQGLADTFFKMRMPFDGEDAKKLNLEIFETIYYGAMEESVNLAQQFGRYATFDDSPLANGLILFSFSHKLN